MYGVQRDTANIIRNNENVVNDSIIHHAHNVHNVHTILNADNVMIGGGEHEENDAENRNPNVIGNAEDLVAAADKHDKKRKITRQ